MTQEYAVCHIPPETTSDQPGPTNLPGIPPPNASIPGLLATVNAMRQTILIITGQQGVGGPRGQAGPRGKDANAKGQWTENKANRVTAKVKVYSKTDPTQFVEVEQVNQIEMVNKDTKQTWKWRR
jgi:hypothetical protein